MAPTVRIFENLRESSRISKNLRESSRISKNLRESSRIFENLRESLRISENLRELPGISENQNVRDHWSGSENLRESPRIRFLSVVIWWFPRKFNLWFKRKFVVCNLFWFLQKSNYSEFIPPFFLNPPKWTRPTSLCVLWEHGFHVNVPHQQPKILKNLRKFLSMSNNLQNSGILVGYRWCLNSTVTQPCGHNIIFSNSSAESPSPLPSPSPSPPLSRNPSQSPRACMPQFFTSDCCPLQSHCSVFLVFFCSVFSYI